MIKIENEKEVANKLKIVQKGIFELLSSDGKDIVKEVRNDVRPLGTKISRESRTGEPRDAMFEAAYNAELTANTDMINQVDKDMTDEELTKKEEEVVDRFIRDFIDKVFKGL